jgi:hypothetical protein
MSRALLGLFAALVLAGCSGILGIEDHVYLGADAGNAGDGSDGAASQLCQEYCDVVLKNCVGQYAVYTGMETCLGVCSKLPPGDRLEPLDDNSVACRKRQADQAETEPQFFCPLAGPGGGGKCGSNCDGWCTLIKAACPDNLAAVPDCVQACSALKDVGTFDVVANHEGDTLQCRLVHVSTATVDPTTHCPHTQIHPAAPWCLWDQTKPPDCAEYCRLNAAACSGDNSVYESTAQCMAVCAALPPGTYGDRMENTDGCRLWHCYNSLLDPISHCSHTGPGGDGHCGADAPDDTANCHAYCILLQAACSADFDTKFGGMQASCQKDCSNKPAEFGAKMNSKYKISTSQAGNTLQCRLLHTSRALTVADPVECAAAFGNPGSACQ